MSFFKKNPLFCIFVILCVAACLVGVYLTFTASGKVDEAKRSLTGAEAQLSSLLNASPAPTEDNLEAAERNLAELRSTLAEIRGDLQKGASLSPSEDGVSVLAGIQQYISKFQKATAAHKDETGVPAEINTPDNFAFGFKQYVKEAPIPEDPKKVAQLDKQRQILSYLLTQLIEADPQSIDGVDRELLESEKQVRQSAFSIDPVISARVPGAIETMAFRLTFSGYTDCLREFLNSLASFELPIVVRSIQVERPSGSETLVAPTRNNNPTGIFDLFSEAETTETKSEVPEEAQAVIEENISKFTVILEFIDVILPETRTQEDSDPA